MTTPFQLLANATYAWFLNGNEHPDAYLMSYDKAIAKGIPFAVVFVHEGNQYAVIHPNEKY